jgi:hypothetical protein
MSHGRPARRCCVHVLDLNVGMGEQWASLMLELTQHRPRAMAALVSPASHHPLELQLIHENLAGARHALLVHGVQRRHPGPVQAARPHWSSAMACRNALTAVCHCSHHPWLHYRSCATTAPSDSDIDSTPREERRYYWPDRRTGVTCPVQLVLSVFLSQVVHA